MPTNVTDAPLPGQKYQLSVEFPGNTPEDEARIIEAEELLREELWTGLVSGHETSGGHSRLLVTTGAPRPCLADITRRLRWIQMAPTSASRQPVHQDRSGQILVDGQPEAVGLVAALDA